LARPKKEPTKENIINGRDEKITNKDKKEKTIYFPTGSTLLDLVMCGVPHKKGLMGGKIHRFSGDKSAGKSFIASEIVAASKRKYGDKFKFNYDDSESGNTIDMEDEECKEALYNFKLITDKSKTSATVQELYINIDAFFNSVKDDEYGIYVVDSLDGIGSIESKERSSNIRKKGAEHKEGTYSVEKQKFLKQTFFPEIASLLSKKPNCLLLMVGQLISNIGGSMFSPDLVTTGGKGFDYFTHSHLFIKSFEKLERTIEKQKRPYGVRLRCKTQKLKAPRPYREAFITLIFSHGIDDIMDNLDFYFGTLTPEGKRQKIEGKNAWEWEGTFYVDREDLLIKIENDDLEDKLIKLVEEKWERIEEKVKPKRKRRV
jgi:RecA/RadA recombinase